MVAITPLTGISDTPPQNVPLTQDKFDRGVISLIDQSKLPKNALKEADNIVLSEDGAPKVRPGLGWYGASAVPYVRGALTSSRTNLITNPSFEVDTAGWSSIRATLAKTSTTANQGLSSLQVTVTSVAGNPAALYSFSGLSVGQSYTISAYVKANANDLEYIYCGELTNLYVEITQASGSWQRISATGVCSTASGTLEIGVGASSTAVNDKFYIDGVLLEQTTTLQDYFDGSSTDTDTVDYSWTGTAHASTSVRGVYTVTYPALDGGGMFVASDDTTHLIQIIGGVIYRSTNDGATWTQCTGASFTAGKKVKSIQANNVMYLYDQFDNIVRYDGSTTLQTYVALPTPVGNVPTKTGLAGTTVYTYGYRVAAVNNIGYTLASPRQTIGVDRLRTSFDSTNFVTFSWTSVPGAVRYDIYVGQTSGEEAYIGSVEGEATTTYQDRLGAIEQVANVVPDSNTTQGPRVGDMAVIGTRIYATADYDFPYRVWISGAGRYMGMFSSAYDATYIDLQKGGLFKPVKCEDYRDGKGTPLATVWCRSKDGKGCVWQGTLESFTVGTITFPVPNFYKLPGSRGTDAPMSVINVLNDYFYYNSQAFYNLGSRAQFMNLLSTDEASANIRPDVKKITASAASGIVAHFEDAKLLISVPYNNSTNNATIMYDTERKAWLPRAYTVGFERFFSYVDQSNVRHTLAWKPGDNKFTEISDKYKGDYGVPFYSSLSTGLMHVNPRNRMEFMWIEEAEVEFANPEGEIMIELSGITREDGFKSIETKTIAQDKVSYSWTTGAWTKHKWTNVSQQIQSYSEPSVKRFFSVQEDVNAYQYRVTTNSLASNYVLRTLQVNGTATQAGKPRNWELFN